MSYTASQLATLRAAIASGLTEVRYADGSTAKYRTLDEMRAIEASMAAQLEPVTAAPGTNPRVTVATFE